MKSFPWRRWSKATFSSTISTLLSASSACFDWARTLFPARARRYRRWTQGLGLELLETRITPSGTTYTWTGADGTGNWSDPLNWLGNAAPTSNPQNTLVFDNHGAGHLNTNDDIANLNVGTVSISLNNYILGSSTGLQLIIGGLGTGESPGNAGGQLTDSGTGDVISLGLVLGSNGVNPAADTISVGSGNAATPGLTISGTVSGLATAELLSNGVGALVLSANNSTTLLGPVDITAGLLTITNAGALGSASGSNQTTLSSGATLQVDNTSGSMTTTPIQESLVVSGSSQLEYTDGSNNHNIIWAGNISITGNSAVLTLNTETKTGALDRRWGDQ